MQNSIFSKTIDFLSKASLLNYKAFDKNLQKNYENLIKSLTTLDITPYTNSINSSTVFTKKPDKLESVALYQTIDLISEGEVEGLCDSNGNKIKISNDNSKNEDLLKGFYLNDVPVKDTNTNLLNYQRMFFEVRNGQEDQDLLTEMDFNISFKNSYETYNYNSELIGASPNDNTAPYDPWHGAAVFRETGNLLFWDNGVSSLTNNVIKRYDSIKENNLIKVQHKVKNENASLVQIVFSAVLQSLSGGNTKDNSVVFAVVISYEKDRNTLSEGGSKVEYLCNINGIATSPYERTYIFPLPPSIPGVKRIVTIYKITRELEITKVGEVSSVSVKTISEIVQKKINYTESCVAASLFDARSLNQIPKRTFDFKLKKVKVPSNYDPETKTYEGNWDGNFKNELEWTDNPAWIYNDILIDEKYGLGKYGFKKSYIDKWALYSIGKYCDELVKTNNFTFDKTIDFSVNKNSTKITIDDSTNNYGEAWYLENLPQGKTVCLFDLKDESDEELDFGYKRVIYNPIYENNSYSFIICEEPKINKIFKENASLQSEYFAESPEMSAKDWFILKAINGADSQDQDIINFLNGKSLNEEIRSGKLMIQERGDPPILEPRFTCNLYLDSFQPAIDTLNDIAAIFRGITHWTNGYIFVSSDRKKDPIMLFTNSDVLDGIFKYTGSAKTARTTAVLVRYNNELDDYTPEVEYIEDPAGIREYGYISKEIISIGTTSQSQANRIGKWILYTNQTENNLVQFNTDIKGSYLMPGDVILIQDKLRSTKRYGGRIKSINYAEKSIQLDKPIAEDIVGEKITLIVPKENKTIRQLNSESRANIKKGFYSGETYEGVSDSEIENTRQPQIKQFTISEVTDNYIIKISETEDEDFNLVPNGSIWSVQNTDESVNIKEIEYRIVSVQENSLNNYTITAMLYNRTKFDAIDKRKSLSKNIESESQLITIGNAPNSMSGSQVTSEEIVESYLTDSYYDASFVYRKSNSDMVLKVNFDNLIGENDINEENTGGYVVEVYKDGDKVRFALDGHDNTQFQVFLGNKVLYKRVSYQIYRYDTNYKLESLNL